MKVEIELKNFTPILDCLTDKYGLITAAIYGAVWRFAQQDDHKCYASLDKIANRAGTSRKTAERHIKKLCGDGYLIDLTPEMKHAPHQYACTGKANLTGIIKPITDLGQTQSLILDDIGKSESLTGSDTESYQGKSESLTKKQDKKELKKEKESSANAEFDRPISFLSEKEIKELAPLPLSSWKQHLEDEKAERNRSGVITFLRKKVAIGPLLPDSPAGRLLFEKITLEYDARGRKPPKNFPTLACKQKFDLAASKLNGTLETAISRGLEQGITAIPKLVNYIASPKWQEDNNNGQKRTGVTQPKTTKITGKNQGQSATVPVGSGQTPEMRRKLYEAFGYGGG